ncbi:MAG: aminoglycoside phosphotransferase family protein [Candidatus Dormibacteraeota bacterium]|nr:aminoglycoside phosphotransferase family protein [Candidatus Dormibacteraeota bacterium]
MDVTAAEEWVRKYVEPSGAIEMTHDRPWATVMRVPVAGGVKWFKACAQVQAFEPRLTAELYARWPDRVTEVLAIDETRHWLLLGDAGMAVVERGNPPEAWLEALPLYAELQKGETAFALEHVDHGLPDLRMAALPAGYERLLASELPLANRYVKRLSDYAPRFAELCAALAELGIQESIQHDDLHMRNLYSDGGRLRVVDWGDSSIAHPFFSLVVTFRFLEEFNHLAPGDPWFRRLRDAYLEPWGSGLLETFEIAMRVGCFAHAIAWTRQRQALPPEAGPDFDRAFAIILGRALEAI